jgi:hypothetical protein
MCKKNIQKAEVCFSSGGLYEVRKKIAAWEISKITNFLRRFETVY